MGYFDRAFPLVVGIEAGLSIDTNDPGNWTGGKVGQGVLKGTKYGISAAQYPNVDIANLTLDQAKAIYLSDYWNAVSGDALPWPLSLLVFDCAVNQGQGTARTLMQTALGVVADGVIGPKTLAAASTSGVYHWAHFMDLRVKRYLANPNADRYSDGWIIRCFVCCIEAETQGV